MSIPNRVYTVTMTAAAATAAIEFFELIAGATTAIALLGLDVGQTTEAGDAMDEQIGWYVKRAGGSYTSGSGGTAGTIVPVQPGYSAATFTSEVGNTTKLAVGTGTLVTLHRGVFNVRAGLREIWTPDSAFCTGVSQALVVGLEAAPADAITWYATAYVAELVP